MMLSNNPPAHPFAWPVATTPLAAASTSADRSAHQAHVLLLDPNAGHQHTLATQLSLAGYCVTGVISGAAAFQAVLTSQPNLIVLDPQLPDIDGISLCRTLRQHTSAPIIAISAIADEAFTVALLDAGANDYIAKPLSYAEFQARVRVALRYLQADCPTTAASQIRVGDLVADTGRHVATRGVRGLTLTPTEWDLLCLLMRAPSYVQPYAELLEQLWPGEHRPVRALHNIIAPLRQKLGPPRLIENVRGVGYRLLLNEASH